jgi:hypothetical protein
VGFQWGKRERRGLAGDLRSGQLLLLRKWKEFEDSSLLADGEGCGVEFDRAGGGRTDRRRDKGEGWAWRGAVMPLESRRCGIWKLADRATKWCSDAPSRLQQNLLRKKASTNLQQLWSEIPKRKKNSVSFTKRIEIKELFQPNLSQFIYFCLIFLPMLT